MKRAITKGLLTILFLFFTNFVFAISGGDKASIAPKIDSSVLFSGRQFIMFKDSTYIYLDELTPEEEILLNNEKFTIKGKTYKQDQIRMKYHRSIFTIEEKDGTIFSTYLSDTAIRSRIIGFNGVANYQKEPSNNLKTLSFTWQMYLKDFNYRHMYTDRPKDLLALVKDEPESLKEMQITLSQYKRINRNLMLASLGIIIAALGAIFFFIPIAILAWLFIIVGLATYIIFLIRFNRIKHKVERDSSYKTVIHNYNVRSMQKK